MDSCERSRTRGRAACEVVEDVRNLGNSWPPRPKKLRDSEHPPKLRMQPRPLALLCCREVNGLVKYFLDPTNRLPALPTMPDPEINDFPLVPAARLTASYSFEPIPRQTLPNSSICNYTRETHHRTSIIKDYITTWWPTRRHAGAYRYRRLGHSSETSDIR